MAIPVREASIVCCARTAGTAFRKRHVPLPRLQPILIALGLLPTFVAGADTLTGKVVAIADGDTVTVLDPDKKQVKVRLLGIDAPERAQPFFNKSKNALDDLVHEEEVGISFKGPDDRCGRRIGLVKIGVCNVIAKLVRDGWAWHFGQYADDDEELVAPEKEARKEKPACGRTRNRPSPGGNGGS